MGRLRLLSMALRGISMAVVFIVILAAVHAASAQVENLGESAEEKHQLVEVEDDVEDANNLEKSRTLMWGNFKKIVNSYLTENKRLVEQNYRISLKIDAQRLGVDPSSPIRYTKVPNFLFKTASLPADNEMTLEGCQVECNKGFLCKSFCYNKVSMQCRTSTATLKYSPKATMYLKKEKGEGDPGDNYQEIPGLVGDASAGSIIPDMTFLECKSECTQGGESCKAFVYYAKTRGCASVGEDISFSNEWEYQEKLAIIKTTFEEDTKGKENEFKKKLRDTWNMQNKEEIVRETVTKKEVKEKCKYDKQLTEGLANKKRIVEDAWAGQKKEKADLLGSMTMQRNKIQLAQEAFLRFKTKALKRSLTKELLSKQGYKAFRKNMIKEIYSKIDDARVLEEDATTEREKWRAEVTAQRKVISTQTSRKDQLTKSIDAGQALGKLLDAKHTVASTNHNERCEGSQTSTTRAELAAAREVANAARGFAVDAEKKAKEFQAASEKANKALVSAKDTEGTEEIQEAANVAGDEADMAVHDAKVTSKKELAATTAKDELELKLKKEVEDTKALKEKLHNAKIFLKELEEAEAGVKGKKEGSEKKLEEDTPDEAPSAPAPSLI